MGDKREVTPDFLLEKILRPYFKHKKYFFAIDNGKDQEYEINDIAFSTLSHSWDSTKMVANIKTAGWKVIVKYGDCTYIEKLKKYGNRPYTENIEVPLDELLVFIFENKINEK